MEKTYRHASSDRVKGHSWYPNAPAFHKKKVYSVQKATPEQTLERLVQLYQRPLLRMCCVILRDAASAEDAVQETYLRAYRGLNAFRGASSEKTWLTAIALNVCRDMRKSAWWRHTERRFTPEDMEGKPSTPACAAQGEYLALGQAVARLPEKYRNAVLLYYDQDMTLAEAAQVLKTSPATVSKRLARARAMLKEELEVHL